MKQAITKIRIAEKRAINSKVVFGFFRDDGIETVSKQACLIVRNSFLKSLPSFLPSHHFFEGSDSLF